jgi:hypothetical protein
MHHPKPLNYAFGMTSIGLAAGDFEPSNVAGLKHFLKLLSKDCNSLLTKNRARSLRRYFTYFEVQGGVIGCMFWQTFRYLFGDHMRPFLKLVKYRMKEDTV